MSTSTAAISSSSSTSSTLEAPSTKVAEQLMVSQNTMPKTAEQKLSFFDILGEVEKMCKQETKTAVAEYLESVAKILSEVNSTAQFRESFTATITMLCTEWGVRHARRGGDSTATRLVAEVLARLSDPVIVSIIGDDIDYFKKSPSQKSPIWLLDVACICGSEQVASYLAASRNAGKFKCDDYDMSWTLAYAIATGKKSFALHMADYFKQKGDVIDPKVLHYYDTYDETTGDSLAAEVAKIFVQPAVTVVQNLTV